MRPSQLWKADSPGSNTPPRRSYQDQANSTDISPHDFMLLVKEPSKKLVTFKVAVVLVLYRFPIESSTEYGYHHCLSGGSIPWIPPWPLGGFNPLSTSYNRTSLTDSLSSPSTRVSVLGFDAESSTNSVIRVAARCISFQLLSTLGASG